MIYEHFRITGIDGCMLEFEDLLSITFFEEAMFKDLTQNGMNCQNKRLDLRT